MRFGSKSSSSRFKIRPKQANASICDSDIRLPKELIGPIWNALMRYTADIGVPRLAPHDLRRYAGCEKPPGARTRAGMLAAVVCHLTIPI
jgi:hypothetical protein